MILTIEDWVFDVDVERTTAYSRQEAAENCQCDHCRNFYFGLDSACPQLRPFLAQFGIQPEAPDRMSPIGYAMHRIEYDPMYYVFGRIIRYGSSNLLVGNVEIIPEACDAYFEEGSVFSLSVNGLALPWKIDEVFVASVFRQGDPDEPLQ